MKRGGRLADHFAQQMASGLTNRAIARWVTPDPSRPERQHSTPHEFVRSTDTLYSLVTALTVAVVEAAEEMAASSAGGRLPMPLLAVSRNRSTPDARNPPGIRYAGCYVQAEFFP